MRKGKDFRELFNDQVDITGRNPPRPIQKFRPSLHPQTIINAKRLGYDTPTPIQQHVIPIILKERDVFYVAPTGTGKTAAYLLPLITLIQKKPIQKRHNPEAIIIVPTRHLAEQVDVTFKQLSWDLNMKSVVLYGGGSFHEDRKALSFHYDVLIGTPGRILDFIMKNMIHLQNTYYLITDESDKLTSRSQRPQVQAIINNMPQKYNRINIICSATFPKSSRHMIAQNSNRDLIYVIIGSWGTPAPLIQQDFINLPIKRRTNDLVSILIKKHYFNENQGQTLIFCNTKKQTTGLGIELTKQGINTLTLNNDMTQREREHSLYSFRTGKIDVLVATDVASRGIDIPNITLVVNFTLPERFHQYVHRIGRTGRIGNKGKSLSYISSYDYRTLTKILRNLDDKNQKYEPWLQKFITEAENQYSSKQKRINPQPYGKQVNVNHNQRHSEAPQTFFPQNQQSHFTQQTRSQARRFHQPIYKEKNRKFPNDENYY